jgi:hypothetical protein
LAAVSRGPREVRGRMGMTGSRPPQAKT